MALLLPHEFVDVSHVAGGDRDTPLAALFIEGDVPLPLVEVHPTRTVDHDPAVVGAAVRHLQSLQAQSGPVLLAPRPGHLEASDGGALASGNIAEDGGLVRASLPGSVHRVGGIDDAVVGEGPDEKPGFPAGYAIVQEETVVVIQPFPFGIAERLFGAALHFREA